MTKQIPTDEEKENDEIKSASPFFPSDITHGGEISTRENESTRKVHAHPSAHVNNGAYHDFIVSQFPTIEC